VSHPVSPDVFSAPAAGPSAPHPRRALSEADAVEIWIGRWLRIRPIDLAQRLQCSPDQFYPIWWGKAFPASRSRAERVFRERFPAAVDRTAFGYRRIPVGPQADPRQGSLFPRLGD
jgi:hypothetical protein